MTGIYRQQKVDISCSVTVLCVVCVMAELCKVRGGLDRRKSSDWQVIGTRFTVTGRVIGWSCHIHISIMSSLKCDSYFFI